MYSTLFKKILLDHDLNKVIEELDILINENEKKSNKLSLFELNLIARVLTEIIQKIIVGYTIDNYVLYLILANSREKIRTILIDSIRLEFY